VKVGIAVACGTVGTGLELGSVTSGRAHTEAPTAPTATPITSAVSTAAAAFRLDTTR